jgi:hypothetical protein
VSRPSAEEVEHALGALEGIIDRAPVGSSGRARGWSALGVLRTAAEPRPVWPRKEAADALGVLPANLDDVRGLPEPAQVLPRPTRSNPGNVMRLWWADEIEGFAAERRARKGSG